MGSRTTYLAGPGKVAWRGVEIYTLDDIKVTEEWDVLPVEVSAFGTVDWKARFRKAEISFTPSGQIQKPTPTDGLYLDYYYPYLATDGSHSTWAKKVGDDIFPQTDEPLVIYSIDGQSRTYAAAGITKMPAIRLGTEQAFFGPMTFTCLGIGDAPWSAANSLVTQANTSFPANTLDIAKLVRQPYAASWGSKAAPWAGFNTKAGFEIDFNISFYNKETDWLGLQNMMVTNMEATCKFVPVGVTETDILAVMGYQGQGAARGMSLASLGADLVITPYMRMNFKGVASTDLISPNTPNNIPLGLYNGDSVYLFGATLPTPLVANTIYYVVQQSGGNFKLSITPGGAAIDITVDSAGQIARIPGLANLNPLITLKGAFIRSTGLDYSLSNPRLSEVTMMATRTTIGGTLSDYCTVALV